MRLSEIYNKLTQLHIKGYELEDSYVSSSQYDIENINNFKLLIQEIEDNMIDFYQEELLIIKKSPIYETTSDKIRVSSDIRHRLMMNANYIITSLNALIIVLDKISPKTSVNSFLIKFPTSNDFEELTNDMSKIQKQLQLILNDKKINSSMTINNWENGSYWIDIAMNTEIAISVLASITYAAAYIVKEIRKDQEHQVYIKKLNLTADSLNDMREAQKKYLDGLYDIEILNIQENHYDNEVDHERTMKIKNTIKLFADIIHRGGEFQPSLIAPEKIKEKFPDIKNLANLESHVKRIAERTESGQ